MPTARTMKSSWFDWTLVDAHADLHRFVSLLNAQRALRDAGENGQTESLVELLHKSNNVWHGTKLNQPDWSPSSHSFALTAELPEQRLFIHLILNAYWEPLDFELPPRQSGVELSWRRWIDTSLRVASRHCSVGGSHFDLSSNLSGRGAFGGDVCCGLGSG